MEKHIVIARRFRPQRFNEVVGQNHIINILKNQIKENKLPHSIIFAGQRGLGKTTTARIFSKALNCKSPIDGIEPCNSCEICTLINTQSLVDVIEIDGASNRGIDEVRVLRENAMYSPVKTRYKIYIIDEVHMLTREAFNALLKIIEEPPSHIIFLMATTEPDRIPITIRSRCQVHYFKEISFKDMELRLKQILSSEDRIIDDEGLSYIINFAKGSMRDAESLLEKVLSSKDSNISYHDIIGILGIFDKKVVSEIFNLVCSNDSKGIVDIFRELKGEASNFILLYEMLIDYYHESVIDMIKSSKINDRITINDLLFDLKILLDIEDILKKTSFKGILFETTLLHIIYKGRLKDIHFIKDSLKEIGKHYNQKSSMSREKVQDITVADRLSSKDDNKLYTEALKRLEEEDPLFCSLISHIDSKRTSSGIKYILTETENSIDMIRNPDSIKLFEKILTDVYNKPVSVGFEQKTGKKPAGNKNENDNQNKEESGDKSISIKRDPKIGMLLETFKADIERIE